MRSTSSTEDRSTETLGNIVDSLFTLDQEKAKINALLKDIEQRISAMEGKFLDACALQGTTVARGRLLQISLKEVEVPNVVDWEKFYAYVKKHKVPQLLQKRVHQGALEEETQLRGKLVPGVVMAKLTRLHRSEVK